MVTLSLWERFLLEKRRYLTIVGSFVSGVVILILYALSGPSLESYLKAEKAFEKWVQAPEDATLFKELQVALYQVPQMQSRYDAVIAQTLLDRSKDAKQAIPLALKSLSILQEEAPFHASYARTSLFIEQGSYQEALQKAVLLKGEMEKAPDMKECVLYAYNLIRIASLQQKLGNHPGEKAAWEELEPLLVPAHPIIHNFEQQGVDLTQYIAERKKFL
ncbi:MAG: hypothetical protein HY069_02595 [Chlamydiia bacterium]|nr:hypothetical protein [Chlamydiia bacterium]